MKLTRQILSISLLLAGLAAVVPASAQSSESPKYEFRAAWIATVLRLDWPPSQHPSVQQEQLIEQLDELKQAGMNAIFFQIRSEADAMYASELEPWSYWLTGTQGKEPDPFFDPLQLAIDEAHKRGMELHAWFNPYRAVRGSGYENSVDHVSNTHPEWTLRFGSLQTLDPGLPEVREHIIKVIADVATRYDIDGVHFDDYFYPYPPNEIGNEDAQTFADHNRGFTDLGEWRRDNVNLLIRQVSDTLVSIDPALKFGISPFGIWKNGVPSGIVGLDAYNVIYADATAWLDSLDVDYLTPQLYWSFGGGQDYAKLAPWWAEQMNGRHLYTGHGAYRADANTFSRTLFSASEIPNQVRFNRAHTGITGSVFFRAKNLTLFTTKGLADTLADDLYRYPALPPVMSWKDQSEPEPPGNLAYEWSGPGELTLSWSMSAGGESTGATSRYTVYRVLADNEPDPDSVFTNPENLIAVTGEISLVDKPMVDEGTYYYHVRSVSSNSIESRASNVVNVSAEAVAAESEIVPSFQLRGNYPNPFSSSTTFSFSLTSPATVSLTVYDALGRIVATPLRRIPKGPGEHRLVWVPLDQTGAALGSGSYFYSFDVDGRRFTRGMIVIH